jgi:hypothetical protein
MLGAGLGAISLVIQAVMFPLETAQVILNPTWEVLQWGNIIGDILLVGSLAGLIPCFYPYSEKLTVSAFASTFIGGVMLTGLQLGSLAALPIIAKIDPTPEMFLDNGPATLTFYYTLAGGIFLLGGVLSSVLIFKTKVFHKAIGILILIGEAFTFISVVGPNELGDYAGAIGFSLFAAGLVYLGYKLAFQSKSLIG